MNDIDMQLENFMLYCTSKNLSKKTLMSYEQTLKLFAAYLENEFTVTNVQKVDAVHIRKYIQNLRERGKYTVVGREESRNKNFPDNRTDYGKPISSTTIANYLRNIKVFFNFLYEVEGEIKKNPCKNIENIKPERKQKQTITPEDFKRVLQSFDTTTFHGYRNYLATKLLLDTGMRLGECLALAVEDVDLNRKTILLKETKNGHERYVYFSPKTAKEIRHWLKFKDRYSDSDLMFPTTRGTKLKHHLFEKALRDAGKMAGVSIHPHQIRNNFAKYYILNNGDWFTLSRILGHSSVEVTQKAYLDFTDEDIRKKYQKHSPVMFMDL